MKMNGADDEEQHQYQDAARMLFLVPGAPQQGTTKRTGILAKISSVTSCSRRGHCLPIQAAGGQTYQICLQQRQTTLVRQKYIHGSAEKALRCTAS